VKAFDLENRVRDCYWTDLGFLRRGRETFMRRLWRKAEPEIAAAGSDSGVGIDGMETG